MYGDYVGKDERISLLENQGPPSQISQKSVARFSRESKSVSISVTEILTIIEVEI